MRVRKQGHRSSTLPGHFSSMLHQLLLRVGGEWQSLGVDEGLPYDLRERVPRDRDVRGKCQRAERRRFDCPGERASTPCLRRGGPTAGPSSAAGFAPAKTWSPPQEFATPPRLARPHRRDERGQRHQPPHGRQSGEGRAEEPDLLNRAKKRKVNGMRTPSLPFRTTPSWSAPCS